MAEAFLRRRLAERGVDAHIHSAGLRIEGEPASAHGVSVLADRGLDISTHRSRVVERTLIERADLVIAMAREHLIEAVVPPTFSERQLRAMPVALSALGKLPRPVAAAVKRRLYP